MNLTENRPSTRLILTIMTLVFLNLVTNCNSYKFISKEKIPEGKLESFTEKGKFFIVHEPHSTWQLANANFTQSNLVGYKSELPEFATHFQFPDGKKRFKVNKKDSLQVQISNEIHVYTSSVILLDSNLVMIPCFDIQHYEYCKSNKYVAAFFIVISAAVVIIFIPVIAFAIDGPSPVSI